MLPLSRQRSRALDRLVSVPQVLKTSGRIAIGAAIAVSFLVAADPWSDKDPAKWTEKDIQRLLADSPWAQQASAVFSLAAEDEEPPPAPPPISPAAQAGLGVPNSGVRWDGGVGRSRGPDPTLNVLVRWDSALPVREALSRAGKDVQSSSIAERAGKDYIVSIVGLVPAGRYRSVGQTESKSRSDDTIDARNPEEMLEGLMAASRLIPKGKAAISPDDAKLDGNSGTLYVFFPKAEPIAVDDKEVTFTTRFGALTVQKRFRLKDMTYRGKLEL